MGPHRHNQDDEISTSHRDMAMQCVWMSAGLITYKLCDRNLDCEHCPLDAALRGGDAVSQKVETALPPVRASLVFPRDRRYARGYLWVQPLGDHLLRVGITALAGQLVGIPDYVFVSQPGTSLSPHMPLAVAHVGGCDLRFFCPLSADVVERNTLLLARPHALTQEPYGVGWLAALRMNTSVADPLYDADEIERRARLDMDHFRRSIARELLRARHGVGATMADGGQSLTDVRQMLGIKTYMSLVQSLLI